MRFFDPTRPRPYVMTPAPFVMGPEDMPPDGATPPTPGVCDTCPAPALVVFRRVALLIPDGWRVAMPRVWELHLCGHHATAAEAALRGWGGHGIGPADVGPWVVALDLRDTKTGV
jgi:hypothetical protein